MEKKIYNNNNNKQTNKREKKLESRLDPQVFEKNSTCFL